PEYGARSVGGVPFTGDQFSHYLYAQDEFRITPNLTISGGLRYEFSAVPDGAGRQELNQISSVPGVIDFRSPRASKADFAPRLGIAWSPGRSGQTSLRAGWGLSYDQVPHNVHMNALPPQFYTFVEAHNEQPNRPGFLAAGGIPGTPRPVTNPASARALTYAWIPDQKRPYAMQWNAGLQQSVAGNYKLEIGYLGTRGVRLPLQTQINRQAGVNANRSLPTWFAPPSEATVESLTLSLDQLAGVNTLGAHGFGRSITAYMPLGNSTYHGLATSITRRYHNGLQLTAAHTWSHNIDDSTAVVASTVLTPRRPQDFFDLRSERADSMLDRRQRLSVGWLYDVYTPAAMRRGWSGAALRGWTVSGVWIAESGAPATVRSNTDSNLNGDNAGDRTVINPQGLQGLSTTVAPVTNSMGKIVGYVARNPEARYVAAGAGAFPNAGRNTLKLPGIQNVDLSLARKFRVTEGAAVEFRAEAYNALNHAQFVPGWTNAVDVRPRVSSAAASMLIAGNQLFNRPDLALESNSRMLQLVLRISF
ncbi:MAG TPA: TonB-dependent receptor, partial [Bryobacteraceae bacterium]|nr:TonB-dependent receptor [Bryobacteraceae bacterium]